MYSATKCSLLRNRLECFAFEGRLWDQLAKSKILINNLNKKSDGVTNVHILVQTILWVCSGQVLGVYLNRQEQLSEQLFLKIYSMYKTVKSEEFESE